MVAMRLRVVERKNGGAGANKSTNTLKSTCEDVIALRCAALPCPALRVASPLFRAGTWTAASKWGDLRSARPPACRDVLSSQSDSPKKGKLEMLRRTFDRHSALLPKLSSGEQHFRKAHTPPSSGSPSFPPSPPPPSSSCASSWQPHAARWHPRTSSTTVPAVRTTRTTPLRLPLAAAAKHPRSPHRHPAYPPRRPHPAMPFIRSSRSTFATNATTYAAIAASPSTSPPTTVRTASSKCPVRA